MEMQGTKAYCSNAKYKKLFGKILRDCQKLLPNFLSRKFDFHLFLIRL